ncbi:zeta toxin family protein [Kribbella sp. NPDC048915]|uniref:zeta toxin family protein n=1 Tax=Kribbella sp. NPDC048915 TaxID=3155148 RepID=UPI00340C159B
MSTDPTLTAAEAEAVIARRLAEVLPPRQPSRGVGERPRFVVLAGQPGAGKTTAQDQIRTILGPETVAVYDLDDNPSAHPRYTAIMRAAGLNGDNVVRGSLPRDLGGRCLEPVRLGGYDVIMSAPLVTEVSAAQLAEGWKADYRTSAVYVATSRADSTLGVANRYQQGRDANGVGRWIALADTQYLFEPIVETIAAVERTAVFDDLYVVDRLGRVLHENHVAEGSTQLSSDPRAGEAIEREQNRPPTESEDRLFRQTAFHLLQGRDPRLGPLHPQVEEMVRTAMRWHHDRGTPIPDRLLANPSLPTIGERLTGGHQAFTASERAGIRAAMPPPCGAAARGSSPAAEQPRVQRPNASRSALHRDV